MRARAFFLAGALSAVALVPFVAAAAPSCLTLSRNLSFGVRDQAPGGDVAQLQQLLGVSPTGYFGPRTRAAVGAWQAAHGVASSATVGYGVVGPKTRAALSCAAAISTPLGASAPTSSAPLATTTATATSSLVATIPSLFGSTTPLAQGGVSQEVKDLLIQRILDEQKIYNSNDLALMRSFLASSTADEPAVSAGYGIMTDEGAQSLLSLMHSIGASIPTEAELRSASVGWQVGDTSAKIQVGGITITLKKLNGVWY